MSPGRYRGVIFDLDGTLVDSRLDFSLIRTELGLADGEPILETIERMPAAKAAEMMAVLDRHEDEGATRATLVPGVTALLDELDARGLRRAVVTRNSRRSATKALARLGLEFEIVVAREDRPFKPDPAAVLRICRRWQAHPASVAVVGDYLHDIQAGRRAGALTVLYTRQRVASELPFPHDDAHLLLPSFLKPQALLARLEEPVCGDDESAARIPGPQS